MSFVLHITVANYFNTVADLEVGMYFICTQKMESGIIKVLVLNFYLYSIEGVWPILICFGVPNLGIFIVSKLMPPSWKLHKSM